MSEPNEPADEPTRDAAQPPAESPPGVPRLSGAAARRRFDNRNVERIGAPKMFQRDPYFLLMDGSWSRFMAFLVLSFLAINTVFGLLYMLDPGGIANMREGSFVDALSFSVQTMATIGYGFMAPTDAYTNALVISQAVIGMILTASYTGLFFAKLSRPTSSVMFSEPILITRWNGHDALMFRVANGRGNEVVEANIRVTILVDERMTDGHAMRRLYDLALVRDNSPLFTMSWTVMHVIDRMSPLHGVTPENLHEKMLGVICMMTAFDATYGQTTHARHTYMPDDVRFGHRFVDLIELRADGQMKIDFNLLHESVPLDVAAS